MAHTFKMKPYTATGLDWFLLFTTAASRKPACQALGSDLVPVLEKGLQLSFHVACVSRTLSTTATEGQAPLSSLDACARYEMM